MEKRRQRPEESQTGAWLITYTDLVTLLLTFFVLLMSMSTLDEVRARKALHSLVGAFGLLPGGRSPIGKTKGTDVRESSAPLLKSEPLDFEMLKNITMKLELISEVQLYKEQKKMVIRIPDRVLFLPDSTDITPELRNYLGMLVPHLQSSDHDIEILGHTERFENLNHPNWPHRSWELSAERAQAVFNCFRNLGISADRMSAHGFGDQKPIYDTTEFPDLRYKNSRVEIVLGPNETLPSQMIRPRPEATPYFNYRNFLFRLFPGGDKENKEQAEPPGRQDGR